MQNFALFDFDDILLEPSVLSEISSRKEVNPFYNGHLPIMTAPMDTVISNKNAQIFQEHGVVTVMPRNTKQIFGIGDFYSYGLDEFIEKYINKKVIIENQDCVLIDVANGHMNKLYFASYEAKKHYKDKLVLMVGNVANPQTFDQYCRIGVDYVRIGIGNGEGCLTTVQTGVGYPMASLIKECYDKKRTHKYNTKIVADGGFKKYSDIIKGLALGADYIMLGSILNKCLESCAETTNLKYEVINQYSNETRRLFDADSLFYKTFRGMSTKEVQKEWGKENINTSEGIVKSQKVEYTLDGWVENFKDYLKSAMSYCGKKELHQFIGGVNYNMITKNSFNRFNK